MSTQLKPHLGLLVCSAIVLAACLFLVSASIAMFTVTWDPCSLIGGAVILPLPAFLAIQQYRGVFRRNSKSAFVSAILLGGLGGLMFFAFATTLGEVLLQGGRIPRAALATLLIPMVAIGGISWLTAWMNYRWSQRLKMAPLAESSTVSWSRFSVRELLAAVAAIACMTSLVNYFIRSTPPRYGEHVSRSEAPFGLPAEATDVSYCQGHRGTLAYEFTIDEKNFVDWVHSGIGSLESGAANVPFKPISTPYTIRRYYGLTSDLTGPDSVTVTKGLFYEWSKEDRGVHAAFDRNTNRAYYYAHFH